MKIWRGPYKGLYMDSCKGHWNMTNICTIIWKNPKSRQKCLATNIKIHKTNILYWIETSSTEFCKIKQSGNHTPFLLPIARLRISFYIGWWWISILPCYQSNSTPKPNTRTALLSFSKCYQANMLLSCLKETSMLAMTNITKRNHIEKTRI